MRIIAFFMGVFATLAVLAFAVGYSAGKVKGLLP